MNKKNLAAFAIAGLLAGACTTGVSVKKADINTKTDSVSYVLGSDYGSGIAKQMEEFPGGMNNEEFLKAFVATFQGEEAAITIEGEDSRAFIMAYVEKAQAAEADSTSGDLAQLDSVSCIIGSDYGKGISEQMAEFPGGMNNEAFLDAFVTGFQGDSARIVVEDARAFIMEYVQAAQESESAEAKKEGVDFLEANSKKDGVMTTASGLQYSVIASGDGEKPTADSNVKVHYHGTLIDGTVFDSSVDRGEPASFGVSQVIKGWTEALQLMSVGDKWKLYIPSELAYGANPPGGVIKAHSVLIFEVELIAIN